MSAKEKRIAFIAAKYKAVESQTTELIDIIAVGKYDEQVAQLRFERLSELFLAYEDLHDELMILDPDNELIKSMSTLRDNYYKIAAKVKQTVNTNPSIGETTFIERQKQLKLPVAAIPKFNGEQDKWLTFKNTFLTMVNNRNDIDDLVKFLYLKDALQGDALTKISIYDPSAANYKNAWKLLIEAYDKKRALVLKHIDAILDISPISKATAANLSRLIDDVRQHMSMLKSVDVQPDQTIIVRILERALPQWLRQKWEELVGYDDLPTLEQFYKFVGEAVLRLSALEHNSVSNNNTGSKRRAAPQTQPTKFKREDSTLRTLVTSASNKCVKCNLDHPLFKCPAFGKMEVQQRWDFVRNKALCRNCLYKHEGTCRSTKHCKLCPKYHHSLLHSERGNATTSNDNSLVISGSSKKEQA